MNFKFIALWLLLFTGCESNTTTKLTIAAASNLQFALKEIVQEFEKKEGINCQLVFASSGKLTAQIEQGAPYDIFLSANKKYPSYLLEKEITTTPSKVFAYGALVLCSNTQKAQLSINSLTEPWIKHIAIANPKLAPYGEAAQQALTHFQLLNTIETKLVFGENVGQVNQFIRSNSTDVGITSKSSVMTTQMAKFGTWVEIPSKAYSPIPQSIVLLKEKSEPSLKIAHKFHGYLFSKEAQQILVKFGYSRYDATN